MTQLLMLLCSMTATVQLPPAADTYTLPSGGCWGSETHLQVANKPASGHPDERAMLMWDLEDWSGATVTSAEMRLNIFFQCPSGQGTYVEVYAVTEEWDESWSGSHASRGTEVWATHHFEDLGWDTVDITDLVQAWVDGEMDNHGLVMVVDGVYPWTKFHSREASQGQPCLELEADLAFDQTTWAGVKAAAY
jgi:hypothetical protein